MAVIEESLNGRFVPHFLSSNGLNATGIVDTVFKRWALSRYRARNQPSATGVVASEAKQSIS